MKKIRLLLIEDNRLLREEIVAMFKEHAKIRVVAALGDGENIAVRIRESKPGVVLLDLGLRSQTSLELVRLIKRDFSETKIVVMNFVPSQADTIEFVQAGVSGFILMDAAVDDFAATIRLVGEGAKVLPRELTTSLFSQVVEHPVNEESGHPSKLTELTHLTRRERQVIRLISDGRTNKEIAQDLNLSLYTIKSHVHNILEKLALHTRVQIAMHAQISKEFQDIPEQIPFNRQDGGRPEIGYAIGARS